MPIKHSIIIPAYNAEKYIQEAIASALQQISEIDEIIIVNDGSTDATVQCVSRIVDSRIRLINRNINGGIAAARNDALKVVSGDYVHFLDHDDLWPNNRLQIVQKIIDLYSPQIISGHVEHFYCSTMKSSDKKLYVLPMTQAASLPGTVVIHGKLFESYGYFDESFKSAEFIDLIARFKRGAVNWKKVNDVLLLRRIHGSNHTLTNKSNHIDYIRAVKNHLKKI